MNLIKCTKGHYYDGDVYSACPYCTSDDSLRRQPDCEDMAGIYGSPVPVPPSMPHVLLQPDKRTAPLPGGKEHTGGSEDRRTAFHNGAKSLWDWFLFTALLSGIPLIFYGLLCVAFGMNQEMGLTEVAAFFFGITTPILFEHQMGIHLKDDAILKAVKFIIIFSFVFFCMFYGYIYIKDFRGEELTAREWNSCLFMILSFGGGSFVLAGVSQFFGGYYAE